MEQNNKQKPGEPKQESMADFEQELERSFIEGTFNPGERVTGHVVSITEEYIFLDIGAKSEGIIKIEELTDDSGDLTVSVGDVVESTVLSTQPEILLSYKMSKRNQTREMLQEAYANRIPVQGRVTDVNKGGFVIDLGHQRAFCPVSQMDLGYVTDTQSYIGETYHFYITRYDPSGRDIVVSRSILLEEEEEKKKSETLKILKPGILLTGTVKRITDFGVFVDIGGVDGLVHISELSWNRIENPAEAVHMGQQVKVKVLSVEEGDKRKIALSLREASNNPWDTKTDILQQGKILDAEITRVIRAGLEVMIDDVIRGFVPASMTGIPRHENIMKSFQNGQWISVQVAEVNREKRRLILSVVDPDDAAGNTDYLDYVEKARNEEDDDGEPRLGTLGMALSKALEKKKKSLGHDEK